MEFHDKYTQKLLNEINELLSYPSTKYKVLLEGYKSSGKFVILSKLLGQLNNNVVFISSKSNFSKQKNKIQGILNDFGINKKVSFFEELEEPVLNDEILFVNGNNVSILNNSVYISQEDFGDTRLNDLVEDFTNSILIIDNTERHLQNMEYIVDILNPKIVLFIEEGNSNFYFDTKVKIHDHFLDQMNSIKNKIWINHISDNPQSEFAYEYIFRQSLLKQTETKLPIILSFKSGKGRGLIPKKLIDRVEKLKNQFNLNVFYQDENTHLPHLNVYDYNVIVVEENSSTLLELSNDAILLFFKDFNENINKTLLKKILKNRGNYDGFIYTDFEKIKLDETVSLVSCQKQSFFDNSLSKNIKLRSYKYSKQKSYGNMNSNIMNNLLNEIFQKHNVFKHFENNKVSIPYYNIPINSYINDLYKEEIVISDYITFNYTSEEIKNISKEFISSCAKGLDKTTNKFMKDYVSLMKIDPKLLVNQYNQNIITNCLNEFKQRLINEFNFVDIKTVLSEEIFSIPEITNHNITEQEFIFNKSIMKNLFLGSYSQVEINFMKFLENYDRCEWFYKNGDRGKDYFSVYYYNESGDLKLFYVDFIVKFVDGTLGLFDTKSGNTAEGAKERSEWLQKYVEQENKLGKKLRGGIVIPSGKNNFLFNEEKVYNYDPSNLSEWKPFSF